MVLGTSTAGEKSLDKYRQRYSSLDLAVFFESLIALVFEPLE
jgi:hypothetical protein